jgi:hypothetical protein
MTTRYYSIADYLSPSPLPSLLLEVHESERELQDRGSKWRSRESSRQLVRDVSSLLLLLLLVAGSRLVGRFFRLRFLRLRSRTRHKRGRKRRRYQ